MKELNESILNAIMLCDPITSKGKKALRELELSEIITPEYFFNKLRVKSKFESKFYFESYDDLGKDNEKEAKQRQQHEDIKKSYDRFKERFTSNEPDTCPMLLLGVAGNGKTIEVNRQLWMIEKTHKCENRYIDLEVIDTTPTYNAHFDCPNPNDPAWVFCAKLIVEIMELLLEKKQMSIEISNRFFDIFKPIYLVEEKHSVLFSKIKSLNDENSNAVQDVFESLVSFVNKKDDESKRNSIKALLRVLLFVIHCCSPDNKHYIVFDNIERYIKINKKYIQIPDGALKEIYDLICQTFNDLIDQLNRRKGDNYGWKTYKAIVVVRRTSLDILESRNVQNIAASKGNIADITGHFQIDDIWEKKVEGNESVWALIKDSYQPNTKNDQIMEIAKIVMLHRREAIGWSYQNMIAPLMSHGIRRNAKAQAHAVMRVYSELTSNSPFVINYQQFLDLYQKSGSDGRFSGIKYLFRRALIEQQFKWAISNEMESSRWSELGIGHLRLDKDGNVVYKTLARKYSGIRNTEVIYYDDQNITMFRRILSVLSYAPYCSSRVGEIKDKTVVEMFNSISLYELIKGVMLNPKQREEKNAQLTQKQLQPFARVLIALSNVSNNETKSAPYVILNIKRQQFHDNPTEEFFASLLLEIWNKGERESSVGEYTSDYYGARITDAGYAFLMKWQASFSFIFSLYCYDIPSIFFLRNVDRIKFAIETVYKSAESLCLKYEKEAKAFCPNTCRLKEKKYLPRGNNKDITYRQQVKEMHLNHLQIYENYIQDNYCELGISQEDSNIVIRFIRYYIKKYKEWVTGEGETLCF